MRIHIIQKGETLTTIAAEYEVKEEAIIKNNPQIANPDVIVPGMKLSIPQQPKKIFYNQDEKNTITAKDTKEKKGKRKRRPKELEINHKTRRPINEFLHDDGHRKQDSPIGGMRMFHPASRPFSSIKHKQVIHSKPATNKEKPNVSARQDKTEQKVVEKKHIYCDCCQRPIYFE